MANKTSEQYDKVLDACKDIFFKKMNDYGTAWRILRTSSLTDQIFIKANRIRTIQELKQSLVDEGVESEFIGIINYCIMALIQLELGDSSEMDLAADRTKNLYDKYAGEAHSLMLNKNHDYGEAWRDMRVSSLTDLILMKLLRIKQIEDNEGKTLISEGIDANYYDIINYAIFAMILIGESEPETQK
ncbi:DUF1599 domain-containing protein [Cryomorpha ignava]|uniref:DUF1599 domain-containing protein n=1 Tax=Cryomorpha ignava TaxID=101383 RepID=A0A7K3WQ11_9FLAO|nr:DUF1599 domain-containing protein [Cryomorpha ignava]NEN23737.1 DUF1599 domain-containing protein [Cryomorpha ignava]